MGGNLSREGQRHDDLQVVADLFGADLSAAPLGDRPCDGQADAVAARAPLAGRVGAIEPLEEAVGLGRIESHAGIANGELRVASCPREHEGDAARHGRRDDREVADGLQLYEAIDDDDGLRSVVIAIDAIAILAPVPALAAAGEDVLGGLFGGVAAAGRDVVGIDRFD